MKKKIVNTKLLLVKKTITALGTAQSKNALGGETTATGPCPITKKTYCGGCFTDTYDATMNSCCA